MGKNPDAGVSPRDASLTAGVRGIENKSTENKGLYSRSNIGNKKGLWLYTSDARIGNFHDTQDWKAVPITTIAGEKGTGFASILKAVEEYYDSSGLKRIPKLAIVVHGDVKGVVEISNNRKNIPASEIGEKEYEFMSPISIYYFLEEIKKLKQYLTLNAQIIFYSCMAGYGGEGSYLLDRISAKNVTTLAESGVSYVMSPTVYKAAGIVYETGETISYDRKKKLPVRKTDSEYSKHSRNGAIIKPAKLPPTEKNLPFYRPERIIYMKKNFFDLLFVDKHLYYLGIMLIGWQKFEKKGKGSAENDTRLCMNIIEKDDQYIKRRDQDLPKPKKQVDGVWLVHRADVLQSSRKLDEKQKRQYEALKATLAQEGQNYIPFIWKNFNKEQTFAIIDAMLQLSRRRRVNKNTISIIGKSNFYKIFKKPNIR